MATKSLSIRIDEEMLDKLHVIADYEGRSANRNSPITVDAAWINTLVRDVRRCANLFFMKPQTKHAVKPHTRKKNDVVASEIPTFSR